MNFITITGEKVTGWAAGPADVDSQFVVALGLAGDHETRTHWYFGLENARAFAANFQDALDQAEHYESHRPECNN